MIKEVQNWSRLAKRKLHGRVVVLQATSANRGFRGWHG